jgi:hypothetical protein
MADKTSLMRGPKDVKCKTRSVARTMTTGTALCTIPKGARILGFVLSGTASNAGTTATLSFGNSATATEYVSGADVKTAATGSGVVLLNGVASGVGAVLTTPTVIYGKYAETGGASSAGAWKVHVLYTDGNFINDDTV